MIHLLLLASAVAHAAIPPAWTLLEDRAGLQVFERKVPDSDVVALRFVAKIDAPVWKLAAVVMDARRTREWVDRLAEDRMVRRLGPTTYVEYTAIDTPFIIRDREFLVQVDFAVEGRGLRLKTKPIEDPELPPTPGRVRGLVHTEYVFTPDAEEPEKSWADIEIHADPRGSVPKWVVNLFQRGWPRKSFEAIQAQVRKTDIEIPEHFREQLSALK